MTVEIGEDSPELPMQNTPPQFFGDGAAPESYMEFMGRIAEPSSSYSKRFAELQRDLVLANLRNSDEARLINLQILIRDLLAIHESLNPDNPNSTNPVIERYLSRFATLVEMTRARRGKTLDSLTTSRNIQELRQEEIKQRSKWWDTLVKIKP